MERTFCIYFTTDSHGHIFPVDYVENCYSPTGLMNVAANIKKDGNSLVIDGGDSLQGTPLVRYYMEHREDMPFHPVATAFNAMGCDYYTLGNHDFNFGYNVLRDYIRSMNGKCICANVMDLRGELELERGTVHVLENGLRVGITGVVTDFVNLWEQPEHLEEVRVTDSFTAVRQMCEELRSRCDLLVCIYHGGFERDPETGRGLMDSGENLGWRICEELDFDIVLTGHQHMSIPGFSISGTYTIQTGANAKEYALVDGSVGEQMHIMGRLLPAGDCYKEELYEMLEPLDIEVQNWLDERIGIMEEPILPTEKLEQAIHGSQLAELINRIQAEEAGADFSCAALENIPVGLPAVITRRAAIAAYPPSNNTLVMLEVTKEVIRTLLERCASYFTLEDGIPQVSEEFLKPKIEHYNYDYFSGLSYVFDLRRPVGHRVVKLEQSNGKPLGEGKYRLVTTSYRAAGTGGYDILRNCPVLWYGKGIVQEAVIQYIRSHSPLPVYPRTDIQVLW